MITGQTTAYISMLVDTAEATAAEAGYELKVSDAAADWSKEMTLIENAQNDNAEAIIIIPSASDDVETILEAAGVKDALSAAGITADYIEMNCQEDTDVAKDAIKEAYEGKEVDFDVIISENDAMACGAITGFEELGLDISAIPVVGIDATSDAVFNIKEGKMYGTIYQDVAQADLAVKACINLLEGKAYNDGLDGEADAENANITYTGWAKVTAENVDSFK